MASRDKIAEALRESLKDANRLRQLNRELAGRHSEPIAIVGIGCRFPDGVASPDELWELVASRRDAIGAFPGDRGWDLTDLFDPDPAHTGKSYARAGGFLADAPCFDAAFFGISPREALAMDPQQRLLLEVCWQALEHAGLRQTALVGSRTGVFAGVSTQGYGASGGSSGEAEGYVLTGNAASVVSGRVSYALGLEGPAVSVDTACSSSLVCLHLAVQSLRNGECSLALAGGVTVMASPGVFVGFSRQRGLAIDGRCKPFAAAADGIGLAEGAGVVVLERLSDALRNGHRVLATVRGSAVNQDGTSSGLSAPNGPSQQRVIRQALANAGLSTVDVDAVEAHGTGTRLGDPIEAQALLATYGQDRAEPLWLGSVKSNLGHPQAAAGIAGVIKMVMALRHKTLPATLHVDEPTPHVDWSSGAVQLLTGARPWADPGRPRRCGVSSFGVSGTNAHVIIEQGPDEVVDRRPDVPSLWMVSGRTDEALRAQAARLREHVLDHPELPVQDVGFSLATTRTHFPYRAVVTGGRDELLAGLADPVMRGVVSGSDRAVFVFPGQGSQWVGMGVELLGSSSVFAARMAECAEALAPFVEWSLWDVLSDEVALGRVDVVQPVLWAVMVSLAQVWRSCGVEPAVVVGHSQGEIAAACVAGGLSLEDGARVVALRSRVLRGLSGAMMSVSLGVSEVEGWLVAGGGVSVAAVNGPGSVVVSGDARAVEELGDRLRLVGVDVRRVAVDYAAHSSQVDGVRDELLAMLGGISPCSGGVPFVSTVTGEVFDTAGLGAGYWFENLRGRVRFEEATRVVLSRGYRVLLEVSPHPVLTLGLQQTVDVVGGDVRLLGTLRRGDGGADRVRSALGWAFVAGVDVDWPVVFADSGARPVELPTYAFQRKPYWLIAQATTAGSSAHPLLDTAVTLADDEGAVLTGRLSSATHPWLAGHAVLGTVVAPGALLVELAWQAGERLGCGRVEELVLRSPLALPEQGAVHVQVRVRPDASGSRAVSVYSQPDDADSDENAWICHATGSVGPDVRPPEAGSWPPPDAEPVAVEGVYDVLADRGFAYGPVFHCLRAVWRRGQEIFAEVALPDDVDVEGFAVHPALLDSCMHALAYLAGGELSGGPRLPFAWTGASVHAVGARMLRVRISPSPTDDGSVSIVAADQSGEPVVTVDSLVFRPVRPDQLTVSTNVANGSLFHVTWVPAVTDSADCTDGWAVLGPRDLGLNVPNYPDLATIAAAPMVPRTVVVELPHAGSAADATTATLVLLRAWLAEPAVDDSRLVLVTTGCAVAVDDHEAPAPVLASTWGLTRSAQSEHPGRFVLVDVDDIEQSAAALAAAVDSGAPQSAIRASAVWVPRLARVAGPGEPVALDPAGTVLITGGMGLLGAEVARHLVTAYGVRQLVLLGRRGADTPGAADLAAELTAHGAKIRLVACDAADRDSLKALLASIPDAHPLVGVVHAAGALDDGVIEALTPERVTEVLRPKIDGVWNLHELTEDRPLAMFVMFSSLAGMLGAAGQGNYAAANAYLDAFAQYRTAIGRPATSLAWGLWDQASELTAGLDAADRARLHRSGVSGLSTEQGLALFDAALASGLATVSPARIDRATLHELASTGSLPPLFRGLVRSPHRQAANRADAASLRGRLASMPAAEQESTLLELVQHEAATVLGHRDQTAIEPDKAFRDLGFDSLTAVEFRNRLAVLIGLRLPATLVFDYPTPGTLREHLRRQLSGAADAPVSPTTSTAATDEPVAIIGMACRFPGGIDSPEQLWELVISGGDAIGRFPEDRGWDLEGLFDPDPERSGKSYVLEGGFLTDAAGFDAGFFGISPREALATDPQQRLLLELSWEALERAGMDPRSLTGSPTGVFAGVMYHDYLDGLREIPEELEGYLGNGNAASVATGRVSYVLGLEGPAVSVDTACSSSLVSIHLAAQSLRSGECSLALAGGVTVMATPGPFIGFSRQRGLAVDGRCKSFAAAADGTGLSEGIGMLVLERLSDAERNGHRVLAVVRGSAVNQDGASNGLSAPNGPSQQRVIRQALANSGLAPSDVDIVEAHGTGTRLGDPIEAQALLATYGQDRAEPLWLGSVKSNLGHTQAAAGVAGVIKMVMASQAGILPPTLHVDQPTPHVDWSAGSVELLTSPAPWPSKGRPRRFGVSSFGVSGTNAHVVIEQGPDVRVESVEADTDSLWVLSARSESGLRAQAARLREHVLDHPELPVQDVGFSLATTRTHFPYRAVVTGGRDELLAGLADPVMRGVVSGSDRAVFVFPGQGSQWVGMGVELLGSSSVFAARMAECAEALAPFVEWSLWDVLSDEVALGRVDVVQPVLWAVMVSLAQVWRSCGVEPAVVVGHSQGEIAAACVAGGLSLEDGARVVALRSRVLRGLSGAMMSVSLGVSEVEGWLVAGGGVSVAAVNGPGSVVVSGDARAVEELGDRLRLVGVDVRRVAVDYAAHSSQVDGVRDELLAMLGGISPCSGGVPFVSTVTGEVFDTAGLGAGYWFENLRGRVRFEEATRVVLSRGYRVLLEVSPHPVLTLGLQQTVDVVGGDVRLLGTLRRGDGGADRVRSALGWAFVAGVDVDWGSVFGGVGRVVDVPTYAFEHQRYWLSKPDPREIISSADQEFWDAVEKQDGADLAAMLDMQPLSDELPSWTAMLASLSRWHQRRQALSGTRDWRYRISWKGLADDTEPSSGRWLVVEPGGVDSPWGQWCVDALVAQGVDVGRLVVEGSPDRDLLVRLLSDTIAGLGWDSSVTGVLSLLALDERPVADCRAVGAGLAGTLTLLQACADAHVEAPLWSVTSGAVSTGPTDPLREPAQAAVWGLGRAAALEHPQHWGGLLDLPVTPAGDLIERFGQALGSSAGEDQLALRESGTYSRRLLHAPVIHMSRTWQPDGTILITGGTGALGTHLARWLAEQGAEHVLLTSRRGPDTPGAVELAAELKALGTDVTIVACDVADRAALAELIRSIPPQRPLRTVIHAAGVLDDGVLDSLTPQRMNTVLAAKAAAAWQLHELTKDMELAAFVLFSSMAGAVGGAGQANYAAANSFLDGLAHYRRGLGLPALSVAWGLWDGAGMATPARSDGRLTRNGVAPMAWRSAVAALGQALRSEEVSLVIADIKWEQFQPVFTAARPAPLLSDLPEVVKMRPVAAEENRSALRDRLAGLSEADQTGVLLDLVQREAAAILGHASPHAVPPDRAFKELGFDSLTAVELRNRLNARCGLRLPATAVFDHPHPTALATFLLAQLHGVRQVTLAAEVDRVEKLLDGLRPDDQQYVDCLNRIEDLLRRSRRQREASIEVVAASDVIDNIDLATDDEIFGFINAEFGITAPCDAGKALSEGVETVD